MVPKVIIQNNELNLVSDNAQIRTVQEMIDALETFNPTARILVRGQVDEWTEYMNPELYWAGLFNSPTESVVVIDGWTPKETNENKFIE